MRNAASSQNGSVGQYRSTKTLLAAGLVALAVATACVIILRAVKIRGEVALGEQGGMARSMGVSERDKPASGSAKPSTVPRFELSRGPSAASIDGERATKPVDGHLGSNEPRPGESPIPLKTRLQFNREYQSFVERAGLSPQQELRFRQAYIHAQLTRTQVNEQGDQDLLKAAREAQRTGQPLPLYDFNRLTREEKRVQSELEVSVATILTPEQLGLLRERKQFTMLRHIASLGSEPFEVAASR